MTIGFSVSSLTPVGNQAGAEVHLEEREPLLLALTQPLGEDLRILALVRIAVNANRVAVFGSDQPPRGHAVDLARNIVQSHVDGTVATAHALLAGEVANAVEDRLDLERVAAYQMRFQDQGRAFPARVAHLAQAVDALVRIDADDGVVVIRGHENGADIRDLQLAGRGVPVQGLR